MTFKSVKATKHLKYDLQIGEQWILLVLLIQRETAWGLSIKDVSNQMGGVLPVRKTPNFLLQTCKKVKIFENYVSARTSADIFYGFGTEKKSTILIDRKTNQWYKKENAKTPKHCGHYKYLLFWVQFLSDFFLGSISELSYSDNEKKAPVLSTIFTCFSTFRTKTYRTFGTRLY